MRKGTVLVVEDDPAVSTTVSEILKEDGFQVHVADTAFKAREWLKKETPILAILDRKLPDADGLELCSEIRTVSRLCMVPVLVLTAMKAVTEKVAGLKTGSDDYLAKPFAGAELLARVEALLRRAGHTGSMAFLEAGDLRLNLQARKVFLRGKEIELWQKEFDLLAFLISQKNRVLTRPFLLQQVWNYEESSQPDTKVVDVTIGHLRSKLGDFACRIVAVRGLGYRLDLP